MSKQFMLRGGVIMGQSCCLCLSARCLAWPFVTVEAGSTLPPRRSEPQQPDKGDSGGGGNGNGKKTPLGAYIELQAAGAPAGAWAVVQWQDSAGAWHDVEGWQGTLGTEGYQRWWVAAKDFGTGPFQWMVKQGPGGPAWGSSTPFNTLTDANTLISLLFH